MSTHLQDVRDTIFYQHLDDIVLLGFSYGGMVVTGLLDDIGDKVRDLVYLDALVPTNGQTALDVMGPTGDASTASVHDGWSVAPIPESSTHPRRPNG